MERECCPLTAYYCRASSVKCPLDTSDHDFILANHCLELRNRRLTPSLLTETSSARFRRGCDDDLNSSTNTWISFVSDEKDDMLPCGLIWHYSISWGI